MNFEDMIKDFESQMKEILSDIQKLDAEIYKKKEQYLRLEGAIQALDIASGNGIQKTNEQKISEIPEGMPKPNPTMIPDHDWEVVHPPELS